MPEPCWVWQGATNGRFYGKVGSRSNGQSKFELTHRVIYGAWYGPIEPGLELDHLCRVRLCANPRHTDAVLPRKTGGARRSIGARSAGSNRHRRTRPNGTVTRAWSD